ncbi:MAG TPA: hypothetical protein ACFCUD_08815 [Cyclobacteriaceae bacterium]
MKQIFTIIILTGITNFLYGQYISLQPTVGLPQNDFNEATDATGFGIDLTGLYQFHEIFGVGASANYIIYGLNYQDQDLFAQITSGNTVIGQIEIPLTMVNTNWLFGFHSILRATAPTTGFKPYIEGLLGFRYISTATKVRDRSSDSRWSNDDDDVIFRVNNINDWIFSYGFGGGFMIRLAPKVYFDLRAHFLYGGDAEFYDGSDTEKWEVTFSGGNFDPETVDGDNLEFGAEPRKSETDILMLQFGVGFKFK